MEINRRDAVYMTVNMAIPLAIMYGAHSSCGENEGTKRVSIQGFLTRNEVTGKSMIAYLTDGHGQHTFYHDANDIPTVFATK